MTPKFPERVRFNWGYHDGRLNKAKGIDRRLSTALPAHRDANGTPLPGWDEAYCAGYSFGQDSDPSATTSDPAWLAHNKA